MKITGRNPSSGNSKDVEIIASLRYLSNFWRTTEMPLINCELNLIVRWSSTCVINNSAGVWRLTIIDTKLYVPVVFLSGFKKKLNWDKYQSEPKSYAQNQYLNYLIDPNLGGVNRLFALSFENGNSRILHSEYYFPKVEIKGYNVRIECKKNFDQPVKNDKITCENIRKTATGQRDVYTTGC